MKCPVCKDITLLMMDKNGIEIDYCPECRWIWLDRGELEKLINGEKRYENSDEYQNNYSQSHEQYDHQHRTHKKKSFLESFDFFD